jgi:pimeloyl-ACP methyl ester carboxylesterase
MIARAPGPAPVSAHRWLFALALALLCGCAATRPDVPSFYRADALPATTPPGTLLRAEALADAGAAARAVRILYTSTGLDGKPRAVSGIVMIPMGPAPAGGRPVVAWAHPTTGVATWCAPSLRDAVFATVQGLPDFLARGYVVVATDYPGLGTSGAHPYLVGISEGRAVLDSVRAARQVQNADAGTRFAVWGHSQGGQAALFAGELAQQYAPELTLAGVAAAAPATDLPSLFRDDIDTPLGRILAAYSFWSWSRVYDDPLTAAVAADADAPMDEVATVCAEGLGDALALQFDSRPLQRSFLIGNPSRVAPWRDIMARNTPGQAAAGAPVFLAQGTADMLVLPAVTQSFARALCQRGEKVTLHAMPGVPHNPAGKEAAPAAAAWIAGRFAGTTVADDCATIAR